MKKIFLLSIFLFVFFCLPVFAFAAAPVELTVTINSVRIPERAIAIGAADPNTEFRLHGGRIVVVDSSISDDNNSVVAYKNFDSAQSVADGHLYAGMAVTVSFDYNFGVEYDVYADVLESAQGLYNLCKADCTTVSVGSGWYFSYDRVDYNGGVLASCPNTPQCFSSSDTWLKYNIAFAPTSHHNISGVNYWRSPALFSMGN